MLSPKDSNNYPKPKFRLVEFRDLTDKELKMMVRKKLNELPGNSERQFNEIRKNIHEQNEIFTEEMGIIKIEILKLRNSMS